MRATDAKRFQPLLLEIGCEEIPAQFLVKAREDLGKALFGALEEARLLLPRGKSAPSAHPQDSMPGLATFSTPRRLVAYAPRVLERQPDRTEELLGPPVRVAFDADGKPTRAAESFAAKNHAPIRHLVRIITPKGEYLGLRKTVRGRTARELLAETLPRVITSLSFPKNMYWGAKSGPRFVRPIRWVLAVLGEGKSLPFEVIGVKSWDSTFGHRALGRLPIRVRGFDDYAKKLRASQAEFDPARRLATIRGELKVLLQESELTFVEDQKLEEWHVNSTEWPRALLGKFDARYLHLPREILVTVMRDHQKYFAVQDRQGNLAPHFVAVINVDDDPRGLIRRGHERVLAARFTDAEFFWAADQRLPFEERRKSLAAVTYDAELGSYADKVERMRAVSSEISSQLEKIGQFGPAEREQALRAVELSKCDLTTQMVHEFPELQGVVGGLYAKAWGEPKEVHEAIYDHYLPLGMEGRCPRTEIGATVSLADKFDSVVSGFALGRAPSGSSDPFALRRHGNGIIRVLLEICPPISLREVLQAAINSLNVRWQRPRAEVFSDIVGFLGERLRYYLETVRKFRYDTVRAVMAAGWDPPLEALRRAEALEGIRRTEGFEALSVAAKRIKNILAKSASADDWKPGEVDPAQLTEGPEGGLYTAFKLQSQQAGKLRQAGDYRGALQSIAELRPYVDRFFDHVLVMAEDPSLRQNRLRLLAELDELFSGIAHFAEIAAGPVNVGASTLRADKAAGR